MPNNHNGPKKTFMMCAPTNYGIAPPDPVKGFANKFQRQGYNIFQKDPVGFRTKALEQWHAIKETIEKSANVLLLPSKENAATETYYDQVFTADASISQEINGENIIFLSNFTNTERQAEVALHKKFLLRQKPNALIKTSPYNIEGTGDNVYDPYRDIFWSGYTKSTDRKSADEGRSDKLSHDFLRAATNTNVISLETSEQFFHIDTALGPLPRGEIIFYPGGIRAEQRALFNKAAFTDYGLDEKTHLITVSKEDADNYACNALYIGENQILISADTSQEFQDRLKRAGYDIHPLSIEIFRYSGGGFHCLTNPVFEKKINDGYHSLTHHAI